MIVDTTAQEMAIAYPTDSRSLEVVREKIARPAKRVGIQLKFMHKREGEPLRRRAAGYLHAKQFKRLKKVLQRQRSIPGRVPREVRCKMSALSRDIEAHGDSEIAVIPEVQYVIPFARAPKDTARTGGTA